MAVDVGAAIVDINMGCPAKKVTAGACGSALMREPALAAELVAAVRRAVPARIPVTVKHRAGWDECSLNAPEFARALVDAGAAMITVHGRTRAQGFSGAARMEPIAAVRAALPREIPVVGNGDVKDVAAYERMKRETGCDAVMIGRGAMGNPWLFRTLAALEQGQPDPGPPSLAERHAVWRRHAALVVEHSPEKMRKHELRKTLAWYSRGLYARLVAAPARVDRRRSGRAGRRWARRSSPTLAACGRGAPDCAGQPTLAKSVAAPTPTRRSHVAGRNEPAATDAASLRRSGRVARAARPDPPARSRCRLRGGLAPRHRRRDQHPGPPQRSSWCGPATDRLAALPPRRDPADRDRDAHVGAAGRLT